MPELEQLGSVDDDEVSTRSIQDTVYGSDNESDKNTDIWQLSMYQNVAQKLQIAPKIKIEKNECQSDKAQC